ncbi:MAG: hypothetical protein J6T86_00390 [Bacteroidales bacterium]|nr:hypothetical protein [Bacteroidales bacterium]
MQEKIINKDYIGVIVEKSGRYQYEETVIPYPSELVEKLSAMRKDDKYSIIDVQNLFYKYYSKGSLNNIKINYLFPNSYRSTFNTFACPPKLFNEEDFPVNRVEIGGFISCGVEEYRAFTCGFTSEKEYESFIKRKKQDFLKRNQKIVLNKLQDKYRLGPDKYKEELDKLQKSDFAHEIQLDDLRKEFDDEVNKLVSQDIHELEKKLRDCFAEGCIRYIHALCYENTKKNLPKSTLMFSTETIGWTTYKHKISQNERIEVLSNFGYGSRSYSYCNLYYRDVPILPYLDAVIYESVSWQQIVNYTRGFEPNRKSCWEETFEFVVQVSNLIKKNPQKFVNEFIIEETRQMLNQLRVFLQSSPRNLKTFFKNSKLEERRCTFVWKTSDENSYRIFPGEWADSIKIEKITGCLFFLDNMRKLSEFLPVVKMSIKELIDLNKHITPMINSNVSKINKELKHNKKVIDNLEEEVKNLESKIEQCKNDFAPDLERIIKLEEKVREEYLKKNPEMTGGYQKYKGLKESLCERNNELMKQKENYRLRSNFLKTFEECKERIQKYIHN